jgi:alpha-2-macroglobulin
MYDKAVEYISSGSNVPDIREFFWKWRRQHYPQTESSLGRWFQNLVAPSAVGMADLGIFGGSEVDELRRFALDKDGGALPPSPTDSDERKGLMNFSLGFERAGAAMPAMAQSAPMKVADGAAPALAAPAMADVLAPPGGPASGGEPAMVQPTVRTKFADTALWVGALTTEKDGTAEVSLDMPENLTTWRIKVWGMGHGTKVGQGQTDVVTRKDLFVRL